MSDFITLVCPVCGGKLEISQNTLSLVCQFCGTEHMVRKEAGSFLLEAYARCPVCNRNDQCVKITKFSSELPRLSINIPSKGWYIVPFVFWIPIIGWIPLWLSPVKRKKWILTLLLLIAFIAVELFGTVIPVEGLANTILFVSLCLVVLLTLFFSFSIYLKELGSIITKGKKLSSAQIKEYENAKVIWGKLYYCHRDDCVYDPSTKKYVPKDKINELLGITYGLSINI
jgi:predicted RNA-binding Zn-ribbon protein involved in translation (DUF1610 family)